MVTPTDMREKAAITHLLMELIDMAEFTSGDKKLRTTT